MEKSIFQHTEIFTAQIDDYKFPVFLKAGKKTVYSLRFVKQSGGWGFYFRITDKNGESYTGFSNRTTKVIIQYIRQCKWKKC